MTLVTPQWQDAKIIGVRLLVDGRAAFNLAGTVRHAAAQRCHAVLLLDVLHVPADSWRHFVLPARVAGVLVGDDVFDGGIHDADISSPCFSRLKAHGLRWRDAWKEPLDGGPFTAMMSFIEHYGRVRGAAFPSAHVAGATAALWGAWRFRRWLFWAMLPLFMVMCVSTIWGRYHYVADVFGGMMTGTLGYLIGDWIMKGSGAVTAAAAAKMRKLHESGKRRPKSKFGVGDPLEWQACSKLRAISRSSGSSCNGRR